MRRVRVPRPLSQDRSHVVINELLAAEEHNAVSTQGTLESTGGLVRPALTALSVTLHRNDDAFRRSIRM